MIRGLLFCFSSHPCKCWGFAAIVAVLHSTGFSEYRPTMEKNKPQPTTGRKRIGRERKSSSRNKYSCLK